MTHNEVVSLLVAMQALYPSFRPEKPEAAVKKWHDILQDDDCELIMKGLDGYAAVSTGNWAPTVGQVRYMAWTIAHGDELPKPVDAINLVSDAMVKTAKGEKGVFDSLPKAVKEVVGSSATLRLWTRENVSETLNAFRWQYQDYRTDYIEKALQAPIVK